MGKGWGRWAVPALAVGLILFGWLAARQGWLEPNRPTRILVVYAYSTLDDVLSDRLLPAFRERWEQDHHETLEIAATFAGSGEITGRLLNLVPAELAIVSSELDAHRLPVPHRSWAQQPHDGILARTPLVLVTRPGNPLGIHSLADMARPGVQVVWPDPERSGVAALALVAGHEALRRSQGDEQAQAGLKEIVDRISDPAASAREARSRFASGEGDVLITYEQDVVATPDREALAGEIIRPDPTLAIEPVVVPIPRHIRNGNAEVVQALTEFLWSEEAQRILVDYGFHSVRLDLPPPASGPWPAKSVLTLDDLGGATQIRRDILEPLWSEAARERAD